MRGVVQLVVLIAPPGRPETAVARGRLSVEPLHPPT
jgi:hypothetical protein